MDRDAGRMVLLSVDLRVQHPGWTELGSYSPILHWVVRLWKVAALCDVNSISYMSDGSLSPVSKFLWSNNGFLRVFTPSQFWRHLDFIFLNFYFFVSRTCSVCLRRPMHCPLSDLKDQSVSGYLGGLGWFAWWTQFCGLFLFLGASSVGLIDSPLPSLTFTFAWAWCSLQDIKCICLLIKQDTFRSAWPTAFLLV